MRYVCLKGTGLRVSYLSLGTMMFGGQTNEAESLSIMDYAYEKGINVFDTANSYVKGESERIVGKGIKGRRDKIILATKVGNPMGDNPNDRGLSRKNLLSALDASLRRLDTDYVDFYYLHIPDYQTSIDETMGTLSDLVRIGKIRYIGVSNYASWQIADILALCDKRGYIAPVITQNVYNAITRGIDAELIPFVKAHNMNLTIYNPIAGGLLTGKHKPGIPSEGTRFGFNKGYADRYWSDENFEAVEKLKEIAEQAGVTMLQLAMKWCAAQDQVVSILTGVSRLTHLEQNIASIEGEPLSAGILAQCDEVWRSLAGTRFAYMR